MVAQFGFRAVHIFSQLLVIEEAADRAVISGHTHRPMARPEARSVASAPAVPRLHPLTCAAVIIVALVVLLHESLIGGKGLVPADGVFKYPPWAAAGVAGPSNYLLADQFQTFVPARQFFHDELLKGRFPLWNPHLMCGVPSIAGMQDAALYPVNLLLSPISPFRSSAFAALIKLLIASIFTFLYLRQLGAVHAGALTAALTFSLSGFLIVWLGHPQVNVAVMLPVLFYLVERFSARPRSIGIPIALSAAFAIMLLGGHAPTFVHVTIALVGYAAFRLPSAERKARLRLALALAAALTAGVLLAAPQLLPFVEYYKESSTSLSSAELNRWSSRLRPETLIHFLVPYLSGSPVAGFEDIPSTLGLRPVDNFNERTGYAGILALFLAVVAVIRRRCRFTLFYAALGVIAVTVIYRLLPWPPILRVLPVIRTINHERLLLIVDWSLAVLAGLGADMLVRSAPPFRPRLIAWVFAGGVAASLVFVWIVHGDLGRLTPEARAFLLNQFWIVAGGVIVAALLTTRRMAAAAVAALCVGWTAVDLLWFATGYNPAIPRDLYYPATGAIRYLQADHSTFRVFGAGDTLVANTAGLFGLDDVRGLDYMNIARYEQLITGKAGYFLFYQSAGDIPAAFPLLDAKYVLTPKAQPTAPAGFEQVYNDEIAIYRNNHSAGRAMVVTNFEVEPDAAALLARVRDEHFDATKTVWLEIQPDLTPTSGSANASDASAARIVRYEPDDITVETTTSQSGLLVLLDTYFPGWTAAVDGRPVSIYRANYAFRAVPIPAGTHQVTFAYRPSSFRTGMWLSGVTIAGLGTIWILRRRRVPL